MSGLAIDLVLNPVDASWAQVRSVAAAAEHRGYGGLWVLDHVSGAPFGATSTNECCTLLGALAVAVPTLPIGPLVLNAAARPVAVSGLALETLGRLAGDRLRIGVGAGAGAAGPFAVEHDVLDQPARPIAERHRRVTDLIANLRARRVLHDTGIVVGANSGALAYLAGRHADGLNVGVDHPDRDSFIEAARVEAHRRQAAFEISAWARLRPSLLDPRSADRRSLAESGVQRLMVAVRPSEIDPTKLPRVSG